MNTPAERIQELLSEIYKSQLQAGGGRSAIPVPSGVPREIAAAIQQVNAASSGPLLTLGVDEQTNSLVVMAPKTLSDEIAQMVEQLDKSAAGESARSLRVIRLKRTSSQRVRDALNDVLENRRRSR